MSQEMDQLEGQMSIFDWMGESITPKSKDIIEIIKDDFMNPPEDLKPLFNKVECDHYKGKCNRYGYSKPIEEYKKNLPKGFSCAGCCWFCDAHHDGRCKWRCYV